MTNDPMTKLDAAAKALNHLARQIRENPDVRYQLGFGTESFRLIALALAAIHDEPIEKVERWLDEDAQPAYSRRRPTIVELREQLQEIANA